MKKRKTIKHKSSVLVCVASIMMVLGMITGCSVVKSDSSETQTDTVLPSEEPAEKETTGEEPTDNSSVEMISYHNINFELEYPDTWEIKPEVGPSLWLRSSAVKMERGMWREWDNGAQKAGSSCNTKKPHVRCEGLTL